ncbi:MAG TPA: outer membrane protein assembly factor BamA [Nitrospinota bacterium]|nr:outer membrane protein assembly factor BamA [Nitrospinota bacterium]|tara:strand:- start:61803 stop:64085 length:2283 start_codon:yes stop_codon:yes gene_type:complete
MKWFINLEALCTVCALALFVLPAQAFDFSKAISAINIEGIKRADESTVRFYIHTKAGHLYNPVTIQQDIRRIFKLGFFDDIKIKLNEEPSGLIVSFVLVEKPFVREIYVKGTQKIDLNKVKDQLKSRKGTFFRQDLIPWDEGRIKQLYRGKGYFFTDVKTVLHKLDNNQVDLEYIISESDKITVSKVAFKGNYAFSDQALKGQIETKASNWGSFVTSTGALNQDALKTDTLRLESFYHDRGFVKVKVRDPWVEIDRENQAIYVTFSITEGERYHVGSVIVSDDEVYDEDELRSAIKLKEGDVYNRSQLRQDIFRINKMYADKGYAYAIVSPRINLDDKNKEVNIKVLSNKGSKVYVGKITISGNNKTRDRVIRRQVLVEEGSLFNATKLRKTRTNINNLAFFETVEINQRNRREEDLIDIDIVVVERNTGQFSFAAGYSSVEHLILQGNVKWINLLGRGQELSVTLDTSSVRNDYSISFTEPAIFDRRMSAGLDIFNREYEYDAFTSRKEGGSIRFGKGISENTWGKIGYKYETSTVTIIDYDEASSFLKEQEGVSTAGVVFPSIVYNTKNDPYSPTSGVRLVASTEVAGFGGAERFYKITGEYTQYSPLSSDFIGMIHAKISRGEGFEDKHLPVYERYFLGGPRSLRGFTLQNIGPLDENGEAIGGEALLLLNLELQYRFTRYFRGFLFYDRGNIYGSGDQLGNTTDQIYDLSNMRHSWGFGVHFFSPIGPISIVNGFKLDRRDGESHSEFHFTIGGAF